MNSGRKRSVTQGLVLIVLGLFTAIVSVESVKTVLDLESDISGIWLDISCHYSEDYNDFWVFGCPLQPAVDIFPETKGFWTPCQPKKCEIVYHGGLLPPPKELTISAYVSGDSSISVSLNQFNTKVGSLTSSNTSGWMEQTFDLSSYPNIDVLKFTIIPSNNGMVLLDKIILELDEETPGPLKLDTEADNLPTTWGFNDCHYLDNYPDFWVYGCPANALEINPISEAVGYWSPCHAEKCKIQHSTIEGVEVASVFVRSYVSGTAEIRMSASDGGVTPDQVEVISVGTTGEGWKEVNLNISKFPSTYDISFELVSAPDGIVLLDMISVNFTEIVGEVTTTTESGENTTDPGENTTDPGENTTESPGDDNKGGSTSIQLSLGVLIITLALSTF